MNSDFMVQAQKYEMYWRHKIASDVSLYVIPESSPSEVALFIARKIVSDMTPKEEYTNDEVW